jgi:hypothetical protein
MKTTHRNTSRFLQLLAAVLFILPGILGMGVTSVSAAGNHQVPFKGSFSGTAVFGSNGAPVFNGTGNASHMGNSTSAGYVVFTSGTPACAGGVPNDNYETLTAANGDTLIILSHDVACPTGPYQYHGSGDWFVLGGTGRFANATGQGTFDGNSDFYLGVFNMVLDGTISAPGGN